MYSNSYYLIFIPVLAMALLAINLLFAPHSPYAEKKSPFECGFHSFLGQNRTQFSISFFIFALLFLLFDLEILLVYPYVVSSYTNGIYGLIIMLIFFLALTLGFVYELGKNALKIDSRQMLSLNRYNTATSFFGFRNFFMNLYLSVIRFWDFLSYLRFNPYFWLFLSLCVSVVLSICRLYICLYPLNHTTTDFYSIITDLFLNIYRDISPFVPWDIPALDLMATPHLMGPADYNFASPHTELPFHAMDSITGGNYTPHLMGPADSNFASPHTELPYHAMDSNSGGNSTPAGQTPVEETTSKTAFRANGTVYTTVKGPHEKFIHWMNNDTIVTNSDKHGGWITWLPDGSGASPDPAITDTATFKHGGETRRNPDNSITSTDGWHGGSETWHRDGRTDSVKPPVGTSSTIDEDGRRTTITPNGFKLSTHPTKSSFTFLPDNNGKVIEYPNGSVKTVSPEGGTTQKFPNGVEKTTLPSGEALRRHTDGRMVINLTDGTKKTIFPDGRTYISFDGKVKK